MAKKRARKAKSAKRTRGGGKRRSSPRSAAAAPTPDPVNDLTAQQNRFVDELLADPEMNATRAAGKAYPAAKPESLKHIGSENIAKPHIAAEIRRRMEPALVKARMTRERVLAVIGDGMNYDVAEAFNPDGSLKPIGEMPPDVRRQIAGIDVEEIRLSRNGPVVGHVKKVRFIDRGRSVELAARHHKLLTDKLEITDGSGRADRIRRARERAAQ